MRKITDFIVNHCYVIFIVFLVLTGICGLLATKVNVNKDIYSYLPADSETSQGLRIMDDEFGYSDTSSYEMMLTDVPADEKMKIKEHIESIEGVGSVEYDESDKYNRDQYTRYVIKVDAPADSETANNVYHTIHDEYTQKYTVAETGKVFSFNGSVLQVGIAILAVAFAMVILIIMSKSWVEPFLFLFAIMLAVVVNKGTNIIFPNVSHITDAIAAILQMALSMDYAIMLSTRYRQEKAKPDCPDKQTAMRHAMRYSFGAISSSSVTTVVGLMVLIFMSFTIGRDMGLVLSKGVVLSLASIFTSLPALLLLFDKAIEKTAKRTINFKMDLFGKAGFHFRFIAIPVFLAIFAISFFLKGSTTIEFTGSENNKIKDVFETVNQMVVVYDAKMDGQMTDFCNEFDKREDTTRVLCYGTTINEPKKYDEIVAKANDLSDKKVEADDYLVKAIYYHYYRDVDSHMISLDDFVKFLKRDVFPNENFAGNFTDETVAKINHFEYFTDQQKVNQPRSKSEIASILGVDQAKLDEVYVLYLSEHNSPVQLTLYDFAQFVTNEILTNDNYSSMVSASQRSDLAKLRTFSNSKITNSEKTAAELSSMFGIDQASVEKILTYYGYTTTEHPTATASVEELINFALTDENIISELGLSNEDIANIKAGLASAKQKAGEVEQRYQELDAKLEEFANNNPALAEDIETLRTEIAKRINSAKSIITKDYSYDDFVNAASKIDGVLDSATNWLNNLGSSELLNNLDESTKNTIIGYASQISNTIGELRNKIDMQDKLSKLKSVYTLYQIENTTVKATPKALVDFLIAHANDDKLSGAISDAAMSKLKLAQFIMNNQTTKYTSGALAHTFSLDAEKINLVYALYDYRHVNTNPQVSLKDLINFIQEKILSNPEYASRLGESEQTQLSTIATLMHAAENGVTYNYESLYRAILPLSNEINKNSLYLVYLYHGSLYDYDENWTLTLEQFINFLNDKVLPDSRFAERITDERRQNIIDGHKTVSDSKELLVGPNHYRALIESNLPVEGEKTTALIRDIKEKLGPKNKTDYFLVGDSAMAYEMSQSFSGEMDFITILTMLAIFAVVVCTFRSVFVSMLLVLVIQCAVYIVMAYLSLTGSSIYFIALIIVQAILMGATIDYAILFTSYYSENRKLYKLPVKEALIKTYNQSISAILTSASILIIVTAVVGNFTSAIAGKICQSISLGTFCATTIILLLLPGLLAALDRLFIKKSKA